MYSRVINNVTGTLSSGTTLRVVFSSGGAAAGGVVTEGQGYGILLAGVMAASLGRSDSRRAGVLQNGYEFFLGWKHMCIGSTTANCQSDAKYLCSGHPCLPGWKWNNDLTQQLGTGSAADGDEDAIVGMILLILATEHDQPRPAWREKMGKWAYDSARAFLHYDTVAHKSRDASNGQRMRTTRLGSCWGGFECSNPSYIGPAHFAAMRDFMTRYAPTWGTQATEGSLLEPQWTALIETSYAILSEAQCPTTGLVPNWWVPSMHELHTAAGCSGSGTSAAQFGGDAARSPWRVALGWLWYADTRSATLARQTAASALKLETYNTTRCTTTRCGPSLNQMCTAMELGTIAQHGTQCHVKTIQQHWVCEGYMLGPVACALTVPPVDAVLESRYITALDNAADLLVNTGNSYYPLTWAAISAATMVGDFSAAAPLLNAARVMAPPSPPRPSFFVGGWSSQTMSLGGEDRTFATYVPAPQAQVTGLVVYLHGHMGSGPAFCSDARAEYWANTLGFVVACPDALRGSDGTSCWRAFAAGWDYCKHNDHPTSADVDFVVGVIDFIKARVSVPQGRTFLHGCSNGGHMSYRVQCERAEKIDGIIIDASQWFDPYRGHTDPSLNDGLRPTPDLPLSAQCNVTKPLPAWIGIGTYDHYYSTTFDAGWQVYSTRVMGCSGSPQRVWQNATGDRYCQEYPQCANTPGNRLCTYVNVGHDCGTIASPAMAAAWDYFNFTASPPP